MRQRRYTIRHLLVLVAAILLAVSPASAFTHFSSPYGRIVPLTVSGTIQYHIIAQDGIVYTKPTNGQWTRLSVQPSVTLYGWTFGPTGATVASGTCNQRLFAIGTDGQVWELRYCSGSPAWYPRGNGGSTLTNNPPVTAGYLSGSNAVVVATVDNVTSHLWILVGHVATDSWSWSDATLLPGGWKLDPNGAIDVNTDNASGGADVWGRDLTGNLWQFNTASSAWTNHGEPASGIAVMPSGMVSHWVSSSQYNVFVTGYDYTVYLRTFNGSTWSWVALGYPPGDWVSIGRNNMAYSLNSGLNYVFLIGGSDGKAWACVYTPGSGSCSWYHMNHPADDAYGTLWGLSLDSWAHLLVNGSINSGIYYVDAANFLTGQWEAHLAPVDSFVTTLSTPYPTGEWDFSESFGNLLLAGCEQQPGGVSIAVYQSTDDGSTWSAPAYPFGHALCDPNVSFDANGKAFATRLVGGGIRISTSSNGSPPWSSEYSIPGISGGSSVDRPWMIADWAVGGRVYLAYDDSAGAEFMYCLSGANCANSSGTWCGPYAITGEGGYPLLSLGAGRILYLSKFNDNGSCTSTGHYTTGISVRQLNADSLSSTCAAPTWTSLQCLNVDASPGSGNLRNAGLHSGLGISISAARDVQGAVLLTANSFTDTDRWTGTNTNDCVYGTSTHCRANVFAAWRDPTSGAWSGTTPATMLRVNQDDGGHWVDHILGTPDCLDNQQYFAGWMDWREDPTNDLNYHLYSALITPGTPATVSERQWTNPTGYAAWQGYVGDFNTAVNARLHGHFVQDLNATSSSSTVPAIVMVSPYNR